jgi:hypothetical protein
LAGLCKKVYLGASRQIKFGCRHPKNILPPQAAKDFLNNRTK